MLENYCKTVMIEANTMVDMAKKQILPAVSAYATNLADSVGKKLSLGTDIACKYEKEAVKKLSILCDTLCRLDLNKCALKQVGRLGYLIA